MAPVSDPGTSPSPFDTLAVSGGYPSARSTGKVTSVPEPTIVLIIPAHTPATTMMTPCATLTRAHPRIAAEPLRYSAGTDTVTSSNQTTIVPDISGSRYSPSL